MNLLRTKKVEILCEYYFGTGDENRNEFSRTVLNLNLFQ